MRYRDVPIIFVSENDNKVFSVFEYFEKSYREKTNICVLKANLVVEGSFRNINDFTCKKIEAKFTKLASVLPSNSTSTHHFVRLDGEERKYIVSLKNTKESSNKDVYLSIETETNQSFDNTKMILFFIRCILSFLTNTNISYQELYYYDDNDNPLLIADIEDTSENKIDKTNVNYRMTNMKENVLDFVMKPISTDYLDAWITFAAVERTPGLLEDKFLHYARCLELFAKANESNYIYEDKNELNKKKDKYIEAVDALQDTLKEEYRTALKNRFEQANQKGFAKLVKLFFKKQEFSENLKAISRNQNINKLAEDIVETRDNLSHSNDISQMNTRKLTEICQLLKGIITLLMLKVHGVNLDINYRELDVENFLRSYERPIPLKKKK